MAPRKSRRVRLFTDRTGTLNLESSADPRLKCLGNMRYTGIKTGVAMRNDMH